MGAQHLVSKLSGAESVEWIGYWLVFEHTLLSSQAMTSDSKYRIGDCLLLPSLMNFGPFPRVRQISRVVGCNPMRVAVSWLVSIFEAEVCFMWQIPLICLANKQKKKQQGERLPSSFVWSPAPDGFGGVREHLRMCSAAVGRNGTSLLWRPVMAPVNVLPRCVEQLSAV